MNPPARGMSHRYGEYNRANNHQTDQTADSSPSTLSSPNDNWQVAHPKRIKRSDNLQQKKTISKPAPTLAPIDIADSYQQPMREKFSQRSRGKGKHDTWVSEQDQVAELGQRLQKLGGRKGHGGDSNQERVSRNPLVAKYEYETTDRFTEEWRRLSDVPRPEELLRNDVEIPTNVVKGAYENVDEYLGTHYELVREDTLAGLRAAIAHVRKYPECDDTSEIALYENVQVLGLTFSHIHGVCTKVSFSMNRARGKRVLWEQSKRLIPGTLVCLSQDNFETFKVATVAARPLAGLELNPPEVDLLFDVDELEVDVTKTFLMVESREGYFEASKWVLRSIQRMTEENMALQEYIVKLDKDVKPPDYLIENPLYNMTSIFPDIPNKELVEEVNILEEWPEVKNSLDKSQTDALKTILTKSIAVIQGPPGTGKTFTSVMALHAILRNMTENDPPVIVACQTNHALDQLLKHVYPFEHGIIRLGGRTQDREDIKKRTMYNVRQGSNVKVQGSSAHAISKEMDTIRNKMCEILAPLAADLISPDALFELKLINEKQHESFADGMNDWVQAQGESKPNSPIATWLNDSVVPIREAEDVYGEFEDPEIDYELLREMEAEFLGGNTDDGEVNDALRGFWYQMKHDYHVHCPDGITDKQLQRALRVKNVWDMANHMRAAVYQHWENETTRMVHKQLKDLNRDFQRRVREHKIARMEKDAYLMSQSKLVGMTTTGLSKYRSLIAACKPKVILIEEAAECIEAPVLVGCMPTIQHMILVGDHKQLKGKCNQMDLAGAPYNLEVSMFERLVENGIPHVTLRTQRRMRPEIREILEPIYHDKLRDHESVLGRAHVQGMGGVNMFWFCHQSPEADHENTPSKENRYEAEMIAKFIEYLILNGIDAEKITILTFYTGQRQCIWMYLRKNPNLKSQVFKIQTVDSFQGEQNDIIILSLVRSNSNGTIGFLENENRVCVALSRAQRGFYIFGNAAMVTSRSNLWWDIGAVLNKPPAKIGYALPITCHKHKERTLIENLGSWEGITAGCRKDCKEKMSCGHICPLSCHPFGHDQYRCAEPCRMIVPDCGHVCSKQCWDACSCIDCGVPADKILTKPLSENEEGSGVGKVKEEATPPQNLGFDGISKPEPRRRGHGKFKYDGEA